MRIRVAYFIESEKEYKDSEIVGMTREDVEKAMEQTLEETTNVLASMFTPSEGAGNVNIERHYEIYD